MDSGRIEREKKGHEKEDIQEERGETGAKVREYMDIFTFHTRTDRKRKENLWFFTLVKKLTL